MPVTGDVRTKPWNSVKDMLPLLSLSYILQAATISANCALKRKRFAYELLKLFHCNELHVRT